MNNALVNQIIETIREDILKNREFISAIVSKMQFNESNFPNDFILTLMNKFSEKKPVRRPINNAPKTIVEGEDDVVVRPIDFGAFSKNSKIVSDLLEGNNVYLMGKAGTGKTYVAKAIALDILKQPNFVINCSQWTSPIEIKGGQTITGYEEGLLIKAWATGGVLILDELPKLDPNTAGLLNDALAETAKQPLYDKDGNVIPKSIPYITNGRGEKIYKGQDQPDEDLKFRFCVIGTGNTDMINVGNKYAGNQRQDYSLVDRFAGSYYLIENDPLTERENTYDYVFGVCDAMRNFLQSRDAIQSISLRTMLNFNRTYEQEMLFKIGSPYADKIYDQMGELIPPKSIDDSISSFKTMMEPTLRTELEEDIVFQTRVQNKSNDIDYFVYQFKVKYHKDPYTMEDMTADEVEKDKVSLDELRKKTDNELKINII